MFYFIACQVMNVMFLNDFIPAISIALVLLISVAGIIFNKVSNYLAFIGVLILYYTIWTIYKPEASENRIVSTMYIGIATMVGLLISIVQKIVNDKLLFSDLLVNNSQSIIL